MSMKGQQAIGTLVIFIALVITAALASFVLVSTTNALQSKSLAVANKTMEKSTYGFVARSVEGWADTGQDGELNLITFSIELAPGPDTIDLQDVTVIYQAASGTVYQEYNVIDPATATSTVTPSNLGGTAMDVFNYYSTNSAYVVANRTDNVDGTTPDRYVEAGELYTLVIQTPQNLKEGEDWKIILRAPYIQDLVVTGYAPEVIQNGTVVTLK